MNRRDFLKRIPVIGLGIVALLEGRVLSQDTKKALLNSQLAKIKEIQVERELIGTPVVLLPNNANNTDWERAKELVLKLRNEPQLVLPVAKYEDFTVEWIGNGASPGS